MTVARWARPAGWFTARLAAAVLLAVSVVGSFQLVFAGQVATRAATASGVQRVSGDAVALQRRAAAGPEAVEAALADLTAHPDVRAVRLRDPAAATLDGFSRDVLTSGSAAAQVAADGKTLRVAARLTLEGRPQVLDVRLDAAPSAAAAAALWRELLALVGIGALAVVALTLAMGGRRLALRHRRAVIASFTDDLTGLANRRAFLRRLPAAVRDAEGGLPLALVLLEVTGLASVNDDAGRRHGDGLLIAIGRALNDVGTRGAEVFRLGSAGFAVILPRTTAARAGAVAEDLRGRVAEVAGPLAAVVGVCALDERCDDAETLLIGADAALHEARAAVPVQHPGEGLHPGGRVSRGLDRRTNRGLGRGPDRRAANGATDHVSGGAVDRAPDTSAPQAPDTSAPQAPNTSAPQAPNTAPATGSPARDPWDIRWITGWSA